MRARDLMSTPVVSVTTRTTAKEAARLLASHGFTAMPVLDDDDRLVGVVTEADLIRDRFPRDPRHHPADDDGTAGNAPPTIVGEVMTAPAIGIGAGVDVVDLVTVMLTDRVRSMPIVDGSRVVGVVTRRDLMRAFGRDDKAITDDVRHRLSMYGGPDRWTVEVHDGAVSIGDEFDNATDRHVAGVLATAVPGATAVDVTSQSADD